MRTVVLLYLVTYFNRIEMFIQRYKVLLKTIFAVLPVYIGCFGRKSEVREGATKIKRHKILFKI
jgi:hypothetical protein